MNREALENLKTRRSIRKYLPQQITDEQLIEVLEAGTYAPTGKGQQNPLIVAIQNQELIKELSKINAAVMNGHNDPFYGAPTIIVVFGNSENSNCVKDASCVLSNLLNAAHAVGLGSCWINRAKETFESELGLQLKKEWDIPTYYEGVGICILGYVDGQLPEPKPRKEGYYKIIK